MTLSCLPDQTFESRKLKLAIISKCLFFREIFVTDKRALSGRIGRQSQQKQIAKKIVKKITVECSSKGLFGLWIWNLQRIKLSDSDLLQNSPEPLLNQKRLQFRPPILESNRPISSKESYELLQMQFSSCDYFSLKQTCPPSLLLDFQYLFYCSTKLTRLSD